jgi:hypothetical protein
MARLLYASLTCTLDDVRGLQILSVRYMRLRAICGSVTRPAPTSPPLTDFTYGNVRLKEEVLVSGFGGSRVGSPRSQTLNQKLETGNQ